MSNDNNNKDEKEYSFIQEQIASKKKFKFRRMFYSVTWTIVLACIFGIVAGVSFCISQPAINKILGKYQDKKTVEFPTTTPESSTDPDQNKTHTGGSENTNTLETDKPISSEGEKETKEDTKPDTVVIEKYIQADIQDLNNIYMDLRNVASEVDKSILNVTSIKNGVDVLFNNEFEASEVSSGLVVANNGADLLILVSYDRIQDAKNIRVTLTDSLDVKAKLQDYDSDLNLAVIAVSLDDIPDTVLSNIKVINLGESYPLIIGTPIIAMGSPNGYVDSMEYGIITSKDTSTYITDNKIDLFTTDIHDNENSDGIIVNLRGEVIGIITQKLKDEYNQNVNTVIGITKIKEVIESLVNNRERSYFGIKGADMTDAALKQAGITNGIYITEVEANSPALEAGLQSGDIILSVNGAEILSVNNFNSLITASEPKSTLNVTIRRNTKNSSKEMDLEVVLGKK
ncbi:PDZ domain-containing protein [Anaerocolumna sedimenticola]|uniref:PDZ domain-containing protein n=1 Tax=Anaerocolumna sedimenticola TaxID=2696063 RepID=A0A6P1TLI6_9FIRM|nr:PDZ domain-containing protein [Anaerocolumna sedimenticola]QHQ60515.1 PDZ domain-containing protein [Anaerocolumna sedimenticola]